KAATCGEDGYQVYKCSVCQKTYTETLEATGEHTWDTDNVTVVLEPEQNAEGLKEYTCSVCGATKIEAFWDENSVNTEHSYTTVRYYSEADEDLGITEAGWYSVCDNYGCGEVESATAEELYKYDTIVIDSADNFKSVLSTASGDSSNTYSIQLAADMKLDEAISLASGSDVTIDLNGYAISTTIEAANESLVETSGKLAITDTSRRGAGSITFDAADGDCAVEVSGEGSLTIDAGTYTGAIAVKVGSSATATISGGTFIGADDSGYGTIQSVGTTTISGGKITCTSETGMALTVSNGTTTVTGGTITSDNSSAVCVEGAELTVGAEGGDVSDLSILSKTGNGIEVIGSTVSVYSGTVKSLGSNATALGIFKSESDTASSTVNICGGKLSGTTYGLTTQGTITGDKDLVKVSISGGSVLASHTAVYLAGNGTYSISGGTISGAVGVEIRAGSLDISGGTISGSTRTLSLANGGEGNAEGPAVDSGAALAIVQHTTGLDITVSITGGTLSGNYSVYQANLQGNGDSAGKITVSINESEDENAANDAVLKGSEYVEVNETAEEEPEGSTESAEGGDSTAADGTDATEGEGSSSSEGMDAAEGEGTGTSEA
ncbi:MAG: hypothetical protein LUD51_07305, partial [Clostridia bacterium]|nr:hypothetical protein [Clostridia bacterium]